MLVESLIKSTVELQGFRVTDVRKVDDGLEAQLAPDGRYRPRCGSCGDVAPYRDMRYSRRFRHVPLWGIDVHLIYTPRRVNCPNCEGVHVEQIPWATGKRRMTQALMATIAKWARLLTWQQVATLFHCSWNTVAEAVDAAVEYGLAKRDISDLAYIGIDEISRKRGHVYLTNVYDLEARRLIWSGEGRAKETLEKFFDWLGQERSAGIAGVCCDMWQPYIDVIKVRAPKATLVFDKFHIVGHLMKAVDDVRRDEIREKGDDHKELMKKTRYIWLKNPWNLSQNQQSRLADLEQLNLKINRAYLLKESFREFWGYTTVGWAKQYLDKWLWWATHSRLKPLRDFAWMLRRHQDDVLTYFKLPINNGATEGLNNKAKVISHKAYGFRSAKNFIRNLYHCMADLPLPQTMHTFA